MRLEKLVVAMILISSTSSVFAAVTRYTITDLNGLYSSVSGFSVSAVNNSGQLVGSVLASIPPVNSSQAFVTDRSGNMIIFDTLGEEPAFSRVTGINVSGQVAGIARVKLGFAFIDHAFFTDSNNNMIDLGLGEALAINNRGQVTGVLNRHAFVTDNYNNVIDLSTLGPGLDSSGYDINDSGQVAGDSEIFYLSNDRYAFFTDSHYNMVALTDPPGSDSNIRGPARFISNSGHIVAGGGVIDSNGVMTQYPGRIVGINDNGQVIGNNHADDGYRNSYVTDNEGKRINLGSLGGRESVASAINNIGQVVGKSNVSEVALEYRAFITDSDNKMIKLSTLVDNFSDNWEYLGEAVDISDTGYIIGKGNSKNGGPYYLLTPIIPDTTAPIITAGPTIAAISDTVATVTWQTDEPASSGAAYGVGDLLDNSTSMPGYTTDHRIQLTGLSPKTQYSVKVNSTDKAGNGPTYSQVITFTTTDISQFIETGLGHTCFRNPDGNMVCWGN